MAILIAVRALWVPFHLAHELHDEELALAASSHHVDHPAGDHGHSHGPLRGHEHEQPREHEQHREHGHEHGDRGGDHDPHPSTDHRSELIARDASYDPAWLLVPIGIPSAKSPSELRGSVSVFRTDVVPKSRVAWAARARAPPAS